MQFIPRCLAVLVATIALPVVATPDLKFDVVTFDCAGGGICQWHFDHLNWPTTNGHYLAMGTDDHRMELATNGNVLAVYYDTFNTGYSTNSAATQAALIQQYSTSRFTSSGPRPDWIVLNEISTSLWQSDAAYRTWAAAVVRELKTNYGFNVILYSPFATVSANSADWQAVAANAYIGIENYLSGQEVANQSFSVSWCQGQYQSSITAYTARGVAQSRLMLGEHFAHTTNNTGWGRSGISSNDWDKVITARDQAALNLSFKGFLSYSWGGNGMGVSTNEQLHFEDSYRDDPLPTNPGGTAPFIILQPQSQTLPEGSDVTFTVWRAGIAPTTYQWRLNGTNIGGATSSALTLTNISVTNHGAYSIVLSNSAGTHASSNAFLNVAVPPPFAFEPFAPAVTTYSIGANLIGQTNTAGQYWTQAGPGTNPQPVMVAGNLVGGGLAGVSGNSVKFGNIGTSARFNLGTNATAGSWYFSFLVRLTDLTGLSSSGVFWAGFNNSAGPQTSTPNNVCTRVIARAAAGGYQIGLDKTSGQTGAFVFAPTVFTTSDTLFLVGCYTFNTATTTDDVSQLWVNPSPSLFGLASPPPAPLTSTATNDIASSVIASFILFNRNANEPAGIIADEIRIGPSWASVTPPAPLIAPPVLSIRPAAGIATLAWTTNAPGFVLESNSNLNSTAWLQVGGAVFVSGAEYTMTNSIGGQSRYYRLSQPQ